MRRLCFVVLSLMVLALPDRANSQTLVADVTDYVIRITTGFTGARTVLYGAKSGPGDIAVVVKGPPTTVIMREKTRVSGLWMNTDSIRFQSVPAFYRVAASAPIETLAPLSVLERHAIGLDHLTIDTDSDRDDTGRFRTALIRQKMQSRAFQADPASLVFLGPDLFRTTLEFPDTVPTGSYTISVMLIDNGTVMAAQTIPLRVDKVGFGAGISYFAEVWSLFYGLGAVVVAIFIGWIVSVIMRKV